MKRKPEDEDTLHIELKISGTLTRRVLETMMEANGMGSRMSKWALCRFKAMDGLDRCELCGGLKSDHAWE